MVSLSALVLASVCLGSPKQTPQQAAADKTYWVQQTVNLYYFPNPRVLAETLNPKGGPVGTAPSNPAPGQPDPATPSLNQALGDHIDALNAIERLKQAAADADARAKAAVRAEREATRKKILAERNLAALDDDVERAADDVDEAGANVAATQKEIEDLTPAPAGETPAARAERIRKLAQRRQILKSQKSTLRAAQQRQKDILTQQSLRQQAVTEATQDLAAATAERAEAESKLTAAKTASENALNTVGAKGTALREARARAQLDAANRLAKFQQERDAVDVWRALADPASKDPVERVDMFVYPDSKSIFLRGKPEDVRQVREIIAQFDRPAPQARITLWTLELDLQGNKGRNALASRSTDIENHISIARGKMSRITALFRAALGEQVAAAQAQAIHDHPGIERRLDGYRIARSTFYAPEVAHALGLEFYNAFQHPEYYYFTRWTLPDPAATTTLGEAVLVYLLGDEASRKGVETSFCEKVKKELGDNVDNLAFLSEVISHTLDGSGGINAYQMEITRALQRSALDRFIDRSPYVMQVYSNFERDFPDIANEYLDAIGKDKPGEDKRPEIWEQAMLSPANDPSARFGAKWANMEPTERGALLGEAESMAYIAPFLLWLREQFGISSQVYAGLAQRGREQKAWSGNQANADRFAVQTINAFRTAYPSDQSNARIAAADEMLKRIMIALEDDLQSRYVIPELTNIKKMLNSRAISVGKIDRTSVIATNRYAARVEGNATAELDLAGQERLIDQALMLTDLITAAKGAKLNQILRNFQGVDQEPAGEFYAVNSGMDFKVTPIFDPTGQALRFQFDNVKNTNVLDSDGTNPALPRVDTHSSSMMVQVSNMEIRELTRFEANTKLGVPEKRWGGIPFLNSIYPLSEIPIIGWFSRKSGRDAVSQTSVIFAQNAMYPTIGDLGNLLSSGFGVPPLSTTADEK